MVNKIFGYGGSILTVYLNDCKYEISPISNSMISSYAGGKGIAAKILWNDISANIDPLSSENIIVFANGPLTGTLAPTGSRCCLGTKSPLTGIWLDSNCGGSFGPELKAAGIDAIIIKGKSEKPVYLLIDNDEIKLIDSSELWGKDTFTTHNVLHKRYGSDFRVVCIGPAGEKQILLAGIQSEGRSFGRGGAGAVAGSKNLKAIVVRGEKEITISNYEGFIKACNEAYTELKYSPDTGGSRQRYGTNSIYSIMKETGALPLNNFQGSFYPGTNIINEERIAKELYKENRACFGCPIGCSKYSLVEEGKYKGTFGEGPDYENVWSFGAQCGNNNLGAILKAEYLCDYYGLDAISVGNAIGFLMECFEKEIIRYKDVGFKVDFGDDDAIIKIVHQIGKSEGIGKTLGKGVLKAADIFGKNSMSFAMHVKGLELPAYDPRVAVGMGLAYATSDRGGCHVRSYPIGAEILDNKNRIDPLSSNYKAELVKIEQDWFALIDSIGVCLFVNFGINQNQVVKMLYTLTGIEEFSSTTNLLTIGERIYNLTRLFNIREGITRKDDTLPKRLLEEDLKNKTEKGGKIFLEEMLGEYYNIRGWDKDGKPTAKKIKELKLLI